MKSGISLGDFFSVLQVSVQNCKNDARILFKGMMWKMDNMSTDMFNTFVDHETTWTCLGFD